MFLKNCFHVSVTLALLMREMASASQRYTGQHALTLCRVLSAEHVAQTRAKNSFLLIILLTSVQLLQRTTEAEALHTYVWENKKRATALCRMKNNEIEQLRSPLYT